MKVQCRTCHAIAEASQRNEPEMPADERGLIVSVERAIFFGGEAVVYHVPCGHGQYRGTRPITAWPLTEPQEGPWRWEWWDTAALAQEAAQNAYAEHHPRPQPWGWEWDPPPITMTCACGATLALAACKENFEDGPSGWAAACGHCKREIFTWDGPEDKAWRNARDAAYRKAVRRWKQQQPPTPIPLAVAGVVEAESEAAHES